MKLTLSLLGSLLAATAFAEPDYTTTTQTTPDGWEYQYAEVPQAKGWKITIGIPTDLPTTDKNPFVAAVGPTVVINSGYADVERPDLLAETENLQSNMYFTFSDQDKAYLIDMFLNEDEVENVTALFPKLMYQSRFDQSALDDTRDHIFDQYERGLLDTGGQSYYMIDKALFAGSGLNGRFSDYSPEKIDDITMDDVKSWFKGVTELGGVKIAVAGKADPEIAGALIDGILAEFDKNAAERHVGEWHLNGKPRTWVLKSTEKDKANLSIAAVFDGTMSPSEYSQLEFANTALNGIDGRLGAKIREELRATYGVSAYNVREDANNAFLSIDGEIDPKLLVQTREAIKNVIADLKENGITQDEFDTHRKDVLLKLTDGRNDENRVAGQIISKLMDTDGKETVQEAIERFQGYTLDDVNAVIKAKYPTPDQFITTIVTPDTEGLNADCVVESLEELASCK